MDRRIEALIPNPVPESVDQLEALIHTIVRRLDDVAKCDELIAQADALAGGQGYDRMTFVELHGWTSEREFAQRAAMGPAPRLADLTVEEVAELLEVITAGRAPRGSFCLAMLEASFPNVSISDMVYWPEQELSTAGLAAEIVRLGKEPIVRLPAG